MRLSLAVGFRRVHIGVRIEQGENGGFVAGLSGVDQRGVRGGEGKGSQETIASSQKKRFARDPGFRLLSSDF